MLQTTTSRFEIPGFALPIRYLGMGVYLAWIYSVQFGSTTSPSPIPGATVEPLFLISNFMNALALIICALNARRIMAHPRRTIIPWVAGVFMCVGTLLMALPSTFLAEAHMMDQLIVIASVGGSVLTGLGLAAIILLWSEFYAALPMRQVALYYSSSFLLAVVLHLLIMALNPQVALFITAALPMISAGCFVASMNMIKLQLTTADEAKRNEASAIADALDRDSQQKWSFPVRPMLLMAAYSFTMNFCRTTGGVLNDLTMLGVAFAALIVLVFALFFFERFDVRYLFRIALPLMVAGALLQPFVQGGGLLVAGIMLNMSHASFVILTMIVLSTICSRYGVLAIWLFGLTRAARVIASVLGSYCGTSAWAVLDESGILLLTNIVVIVLVAFSMFLLNETDLETTWGITPVKTRHETATYRESLSGRCAQVARLHGLTLREEEILALLAQGKSTPRIQQELCISNGTAKSHIRHIYAKLNVHSRDEVIQLVNTMDE
ncbi:response regulator transcription factor [Adlercreutzia agrestimuris]|uniref:response regulator transcription factor n=1 Tax=Adlercreutzia agrestimuris TaxID=2941324 RepID=UPI00203EF74D|nr:helix-turn-helix transcriptional regulator [Adlercreutzia agrestimuris]